MSDLNPPEPPTPPPSPPGPPPAPPEPPPSPPVDWREGIADPELKKFAENMASPTDAVKAAREMRQQLSTRVKLPGKDAKPEEHAAFAKAVGAGEKVEEYVSAFPKGEGEPNDTDKLVQSKVAEVLHKHHVPLAATAELHSVVAEVAKNIEAEQERVALKGREEADAALRKEWGADYDGNVALASRAAKAFGGDEFLRWASETVINGVKLGDHPGFVKTFGTIGRRMGEGTFIGAVDPTAQKSLDTQINDFYAKYPPGTRGYAEHQSELTALFEKRYGNAPIRESA